MVNRSGEGILASYSLLLDNGASAQGKCVERDRTPFAPQ
jgi:hypothetical protein